MIKIPDDPPDGHVITFYKISYGDDLVEHRVTYYENSTAEAVLGGERRKGAVPFVKEWLTEERYLRAGNEAPSSWRSCGRVETAGLQSWLAGEHRGGIYETRALAEEALSDALAKKSVRLNAERQQIETKIADLRARAEALQHGPATHRKPVDAADLIREVLKLLDDCPFGHNGYSPMILRSTEPGIIVAWLERLFALKAKLKLIEI